MDDDWLMETLPVPLCKGIQICVFRLVWKVGVLCMKWNSPAGDRRIRSVRLSEGKSVLKLLTLLRQDSGRTQASL